MELHAAAVCAAVAVLLAPILALAAVGFVAIRGLTATYNTPVLPRNAPGKAQKGEVMLGGFTCNQTCCTFKRVENRQVLVPLGWCSQVLRLRI